AAPRAAKVRRAGRRRGGSGPRAGSLPARILDWAGGRKRTFTTNDVSRKFKLSRAHASMLLSRLSSGSFPIKRESRGVYAGK
ncbi:MAG: hypothetical protein ACREID_02235, partial [Planctomycetota bacterium]